MSNSSSENSARSSNPNHERWLAETWQMIEECAAATKGDRRRTVVKLSPEGCAALMAERLGNETFVIPVSPHMPKRERPAKAPSKSGLRYQQELAHYCGFRWQWLNLPPSEQLETLLEQLADAKDDALRLHHAYVDLKFPEMARPELKAAAVPTQEWIDKSQGLTGLEYDEHGERLPENGKVAHARNEASEG